ncbi:hypothetical protein BY996DRAFT_1561175 [Phakopsora pachyrhizi]|nr:hypothetical protein BY996DRAFT_1561175 [Phakopsora pachyrhizi]
MSLCHICTVVAPESSELNSDSYYHHTHKRRNSTACFSYAYLVSFVGFISLCTAFHLGLLAFHYLASIYITLFSHISKTATSDLVQLCLSLFLRPFFSFFCITSLHLNDLVYFQLISFLTWFF